MLCTYRPAADVQRFVYLGYAQGAKIERGGGMNEPRWYCVAATGTAFPCVDKADAESWVNHSNRTMPHCAPYRAVQLVDAEAVRALIRDDALAISFQTMGQYRTMLLKAIGVTDQNGGAE